MIAIARRRGMLLALFAAIAVAGPHGLCRAAVADVDRTAEIIRAFFPLDDDIPSARIQPELVDESFRGDLAIHDSSFACPMLRKAGLSSGKGDSVLTMGGKQVAAWIFMPGETDLNATVLFEEKVDLIMDLASNNADYVAAIGDRTTAVAGLRPAGDAKVEQSTSRSILAAIEFASETAGAEKPVRRTVLHGYVNFGGKTREFIAVADPDAGPAAGDAAFLTWLDKFLELNP